jgi:hypothetical protein
MNNKNIEAIENTGDETYLDIFKKPDYKKIEELKRKKQQDIIQKTRVLLRREQKYT